MKTITQTLVSFKELAVLSLVALALLGASYANGQFVNPGGSPPSGNVAAPINVGSDLQTKSGDLEVEDLTLVDGAPALVFEETDARDAQIVNSNGSLYFRRDVNDVYDVNDVNYDPNNRNWSTMLRLNHSATDRYALFNNEVRATDYCDENGDNCFSAGSVGGGGTQIGTVTAGQWCRASNDGERIVCTEDKPLQTCRVRGNTLNGVTTAETRLTAYCQVDETLVSGSCTTDATDDVVDWPADTNHEFYQPPSSGPDRLGWQCYKPPSSDAGGSIRVWAVCCS